MNTKQDKFEAMADYQMLQAKMDAAFKMVLAPGQHWKDKIDYVVECRDHEVALIAEAVEFFTATKAKVVKLREDTYRVTAPGYWAGPAN